MSVGGGKYLLSFVTQGKSVVQGIGMCESKVVKFCFSSPECGVWV